MTDDQRIKKYAELTVKVGANVAPGQIVHINAHLEHAPFAQAVAEAAYEAGAKYVDIWYWDVQGKRARLLHAQEETLGWSPPWLDMRNDWLVENRGVSIAIRGDANSDILADLDQKRVALDRMPDLASRLPLVHSEEVNWTIVAFPTKGWAKTVFGEPDIERLWDDITRFMRLDQPDPVAAWTEHLERLDARACQMNERGFDAIRYRGPGTDLTVGLLPASTWHAAGFKTKWGRAHAPNLPTEEIFTTPDRTRVDGKVRATRPLVLTGTVARDLEFEMSGGRIISVKASSGEDAVRGELATDEGAARLGEIALVDGSSPIGQTGVTYLETLLDENATSHIAYGAGYPHCVKGGSEATADERLAMGINRSDIHTDFMVGGPEVEIHGIGLDGSETPIIVGDKWQL